MTIYYATRCAKDKALLPEYMLALGRLESRLGTPIERLLKRRRR